MRGYYLRPRVNILAKNPYLFPTPILVHPYFFPNFSDIFLINVHMFIINYPDLQLKGRGAPKSLASLIEFHSKPFKMARSAEIFEYSPLTTPRNA